LQPVPHLRSIVPWDYIEGGQTEAWFLICFSRNGKYHTYADHFDCAISWEFQWIHFWEEACLWAPVAKSAGENFGWTSIIWCFREWYSLASRRRLVVQGSQTNTWHENDNPC
jgi:hypothetical protein